VRLDVVAFDLDGTLLDSTQGITRSTRHAMDALGLDAPPIDRLRTLIGPPLPEMLAAAGVPDHLVREGIDRYRDRYRAIGVYENEVFDGVPQLLETLAEAGFRLAVATSKPEDFAIRALDDAGLGDRFEVVAGATFDGLRSKKADVLAYTLERLSHDDAGRSVMIGDREHDLIGAAALGMPAIGVTWGFGTEEELAAHRPLAIVRSPADLAPLLLALTA
jgi:phosphoglycolate phosphatase